MEIINLDFNDDLNQAARELITAKSLLVYPTLVSSQEARLAFENQWDLQDVRWLSIQDFKHLLLAMELPVLEDDKRLLCLYQVITDEERMHFHLNNFGDLVSWGTQLFQFCAELCEAKLDVLQLQQELDQFNLNLRHWQEENIAIIADILMRYHEFITQKGFADRIFQASVDSAPMPFQGYRIIFVNQYYYSKLEQDLLLRCEAAGNQIVLLYQGLDQEQGETRPFQAQKAWELLKIKPQITLYKCEDERQAVLAFLALQAPECAIIDSQFSRKDYAAYFPSRDLRQPQSLPIIDSNWYRVQRILLELLQNLQESPGFIPLRLILKYFNSPQMLQPLCPNWQQQDYLAFEQQLYALHNSEVLYLDLNPQAQFTDHESQIMQFATALAEILKRLMKISSIQDIAALMDTDLAPQRFSTTDELQKSDLLPQVWTALANFMASESLAIVRSWSDIFTVTYLGLYELWLDYLKSIKLKRLPTEDQSGKWEISNLLDSRNRCFPRVAVFNLVEGVLPQSPSPIWLLNEHQRKIMGLKTYEDIRDWDRYYFFRLLFCAREVLLFTYLNAEEAIEYSSLIGELQGFATLQEVFCRVDERGLLKAWQQQMNQANLLDVSDPRFHSAADAEFFQIPCTVQNDFGESRSLKCNSYDLQLFAYNPFVWYIQALRGISKLKLIRREVTSRTVFGSLLHAYFASVLGTEATQHENLDALDAVFHNSALLKTKLLALIHGPAFKYKIPKNYNADYLSSVICDTLAESLQAFYLRFVRKRWSDRTFTLIPEQEKMSEAERQRKILVECLWQDQSYRILIRGKADLRIESSGIKSIVDFKTGQGNTEQLIFYEWLYYLLEHPELESELDSCFWMIFEMAESSKAKSSARARNKYLENISQALLQCLEHGYLLATKSEDRKLMRELSRSDLYLPGVHDASL
ncbi:MAG TPA: PD-(D/E)XK nuclease family protein [Candidatus Cloacimonadota bacterium]|nr:PD-(D/E)XK nuclease family protein [Candidatus Cloacimonadota bacterium]